MPKIPSIKELRTLLIAIKPAIRDDYIQEDDTLSSLTVTVASNGEGEWSYQTGDNSYIGGAYLYPHWAVITLYRRSNCTELARDIRSQLIDLIG